MKKFVVGLVACSILLIPIAIAVEASGPSYPISRPSDRLSHQSCKHPKANPILKRMGYTVAYDGRTKTALWVYEELTQDSLDGDVDRNQFHFLQDPDIPNVIRSDPEDYRRSGFDGGHLAPAADHKASKIEMRETFYLSNIAPQNSRFNRGYWSKFESYVRNLTNKYDIVRVITGPLYLPYQEIDGKKYVTYQVIGDNNVAVPTHFFKVITAENRLSKEQWAYVMPNKRIDKNTPFSDFQTTVSKVEKMAGIIFQR